jgi:hypothetical protein
MVLGGGVVKNQLLSPYRNSVAISNSGLPLHCPSVNTDTG